MYFIWLVMYLKHKHLFLYNPGVFNTFCATGNLHWRNSSLPKHRLSRWRYRGSSLSVPLDQYSPRIKNDCTCDDQSKHVITRYLRFFGVQWTVQIALPAERSRPATSCQNTSRPVRTGRPCFPSGELFSNFTKTDHYTPEIFWFYYCCVHLIW